MGTDCAPYLANLYLYALEYKFLEKLTKTNIKLARKFSDSYRYIDDLLTFNNNNLMNTYKHEIYPKELILNQENHSDQHTSFLDIDIKIHNNTIITKLYDKRDDFDFTINNFPILTSNIHSKRTHGIIISQLIRYCKVCLFYDDFVNVSKILTTKLLKQYFTLNLLKKKVSNFYDKYYHLIETYNVTKKHMILNIFP